MSEKDVLFEDNMETQAGDFNNMQAWIGKSIDDVVSDAIDAGNAYVGLGVTKAATTQVTIAPGRLYWGGPVYILEDPYVIDFQTIAGAMPVTQLRQIAIVAWPSTITDDTQPRNFVVDADTGQAQPESVAMTRVRMCNVGSVNGVESPSPSYPPVSATSLLIAYVLVSPSGVQAIQQITTTQLDSVTDLSLRVAALEQFENLAENQIATLQTALAALAAQLKNFVTWDAFNKLVDLVNWCVQQLSKPATYAIDTIDNFFDTSQSAVGTTLDGVYNAVVSEGLRFPGGNSATVPMVLANPSEPTIQAWDGGIYILPKPSGMRIRMDCSFPDFDWATDNMLNHPYWTFAPRKLGWGRHRRRCGTPWTPINNTQNLASQVDAVLQNLMRDSEAWPVVNVSTVIKHDDDDPDYPRWVGDRWQYYWRDFSDRQYWAKTFTNLSYASNIVGQSFLNSQDGWLGGITLFSMVPGFNQPLTVLINECDAQGKPLHARTLGRIDLDGPGLQACYGSPIQAGDVLRTVSFSTAQSYSDFLSTIPGGIGSGLVTSTFTGSQAGGGVWTVLYRIPTNVYPARINFTPVFLAAGKRYAFHVVSTYAHQFAASVAPQCYQVHQGDCWEYDNVGDFKVVSGPKTLRFMLHFLTWGNWGGQPGQVAGQLRYPVDMTPLQLAGTGIASVDVLADAIIPPATDLSYAIQIGGIYKTFNYDPNSPGFAPGLTFAPWRVVFTGTSDLMPGLSVTNSQVKLQGQPGLGFHHISTSIPTGGATATGIQVLVNITNWTSHHTLACHIHFGSTTMPQSGSSGPVLLPDGVTNQFTYTFNQTGITNYQVELDGATDGTGNNFVVNQRAAFHK